MGTGNLQDTCLREPPALSPCVPDPLVFTSVMVPRAAAVCGTHHPRPWFLQKASGEMQTPRAVPSGKRAEETVLSFQFENENTGHEELLEICP